MAVIYLKHKVHGNKVARSEVEAAADRANGWEDYKPSTAPAKPAAPKNESIAAELAAALERAEKAEKALAEAEAKAKPKAKGAEGGAPGTVVPDFLKGENKPQG